MITQTYMEYALDILKEAMEEKDNLEKASDLIVNSIQNQGKLFVFGSGHSHMIAEELYIRAGGLALVHAILEPEFMLHGTVTKSTAIERLSGYAKEILRLHHLSKNDTLLVVSNSGRNNFVVELCLEAKAIGANVIVMTSVKHSNSTKSRHASGLRIMDIADVVIDNHGPIGDAGFKIQNLEQTVGGSSDYVGIFLAQTLIVAVTDKLVKLGIEAPVFKSSNSDGADEFNQALFDRYYPNLR